VSLRVAAAQDDFVVGDLEGNVARLIATYEAAEAAGCDLVAFPELAITGYPPEDLLLRPAFVAQAVEALDKFAARTARCVAVVGSPERDGGDLYNAAAVCANGQVIGTFRKHRLPNEAVFDEERYFIAGSELPVFEVAGYAVGVSVCEDAWSSDGPIAGLAAHGAQVVVNINGSPYYAGRIDEREAVIADRAREANVPIVYVNVVGGQDELVFDGGSFAVNADGAIAVRSPQFVEDLLVVELEPDEGGRLVVQPGPIASRLGREHEVYEALVLGTRDYVRKNGFQDVLIAISGGVDSSIVAAIAVDALGPEHVVGVLLPSRYSSDHSITDAEALARGLGIRTYTVPIEPAHAAFEEMLAAVIPPGQAGVAAENVQARIRGNVLMSISNAFNWIVLTTGNKSEMATGYATLYGDMAGGYAVIKDVLKTTLWDLCRDLNARRGREVIPRAVIEKPPSAELRPDQYDTDSLPPYEVLDPIILGYVEHDLSVRELIDQGHDPEIVRRVARLIDRNEYKRRQAAPGVRVTPKAFGKDRRLPITNRWPG
jgi:NAD+ synthase (glutamine-hydrolysing)